MAGLFSRLKLWSDGETPTNSDLNAEFNNIIANVDAEHGEGYSSNLSEMEATEDPGDEGTENLTQPITIAQELQRIRFVLARAMGTEKWYGAPAATLSTLNDAIEQAFFIAPSRIISGRHSAFSNQPKFLVATGAGGVTLMGEDTPFTAYIDGSLKTISTDVVLNGLTASPAVGNTATLADNFTIAQQSRSATTLNISSAGAEFSTNLGRTAVFKIVNGLNTEYFLGTVASSTKLTNLHRGYLFGTDEVASGPITLTTGHTITILKITYLFLHADGYLLATYNPPYYGSTAPSGGGIGDFWYDETLSTWKRYTGTTWDQANAIFVGIAAQDGANTVVSRSADFYHQYDSVNDAVLDAVTNTTVSAESRGPGNLSVYGTNLHWENSKYLYDITAHLVASETEQTDTMYYLYVTEIGRLYMSAVAPILRKDLKGYYHPSETWRAIGQVFNDASGNLVAGSVISYGEFSIEALASSIGLVPSGVIVPYGGTTAPRGYLMCDGTSYIRNAYPSLYAAIGTAYGAADSSHFNVPDLRGRFIRGVDGAAARDPDTLTRTAMNTGGNTGNAVGSVQADQFKSHYHLAARTVVNQSFSGTGRNPLESDSNDNATSAAGGSETRPVNAYANYLIKI